MASNNFNHFKPLVPVVSSSLSILIVALVICLQCCSHYVSCESARRTYIVHVHKPPPDHTSSHRDWHEAFLPPPRVSTDGGLTDSRLIYSYTHALSGFAARLTEEELEAMRHMDGFLHAEPDQKISRHTTHSPSFLGLYPGRDSYWDGVAVYGRGVIIGLVDTGVDPTHPSFNDHGMAPPPPRWKGKCGFSNASLCNNKLIGARIFDHLNQSRIHEPFDTDGHGTHTAGTAAGRFVADANVLGSARGTAAGMAPDSWVAMYKYADESGLDSEIIAAIDSAVEDGVDVLSLSVGRNPLPLYNNSVEIASFGAIRKGVFVSASAGNSGPGSGTVENTSPWMLTVGASTIDRRIRAVVVLGNGVQIEGESAYQPTNFTTSFLPLIYPSLFVDDPFASLCNNVTSLLECNVTGKVVVCEVAAESALDQMSNKWSNVIAAGGAGIILINAQDSGFEIQTDIVDLPTARVSHYERSKILGYIGSDSHPTTTIIFKGTEIGFPDSTPAPSVAAFSSRGPSVVNPGILKPDIIGPGVNILAASPTLDLRSLGLGRVNYNFMSGTSMSCPHLSGVAALLKNIHPDWSPAMIKSAIMTTADLTNLKGGPITDLIDNKRADFFATGAGHVNPLRATYPGLVYDTKIDDYVAYLCGLGYTDKQVSMITMERIICSSHKAITEADLNYPSLTVDLSSSSVSPSHTAKLVTRTVTNVGEPYSTYKAHILPPPGVIVTVEPETIYFTEVGEQQTFRVAFELSRTVPPPSWFSEGLLTWVSYNGKITVNSPISVLFGSPSA